MSHILMCVDAMEGMGEMKPGSVRRLVEALQLIKSDYEGTRDVAGLADRTHAYYETACVALRELEEDNYE